MRFSRQDIEDAEVRTYRKDSDEPGFRRSKKGYPGILVDNYPGRSKPLSGKSG